MKFDLPHSLNYDTRFSLWQVKMRGILAQTHDYDEALDSFSKRKAEWTPEEIRKDQKALALNQLHLHNDILQECRKESSLRELYLAGIDLSYKLCQKKGDVVRMEDDNPCDIVGIGSVQIKTYDGMTRTLKNVRYIPGMSRNLISLSTLDAEGYKYSGSDGVLKVSKGSLVCLKDDLNSAKLYVLRVCTLPGSDSAVAAVTNDEPSKTNLWHMRLGHMSHHGMAELMKRNLLDGCTSSKIKFCEHCIFGKHKRVHFNTSVHTTKGTLDYVHADLWGPSLCPRDHVREKELQRMRIWWSMLMMICVCGGAVDEHGEHDNDVLEDDAHDDVQTNSSYFAQLEEDLPIAQRKSKGQLHLLSVLLKSVICLTML
ncbi:unnamed protein product [Miscanthus lutarioriparius]|uniref:GAG-pre-integrase domain-containing protein n=1 Tax=Miscanthus lutarioriparius TaxID=422564 RepID=A0A811Q823_9POAL|nr:unnamed protein product [Miscanthus lutarioriparius]